MDRKNSVNRKTDQFVAKMGNQKSSPSAKNSGDGDNIIMNTQEIHTEMHDAHELKLWIILCLISLQVFYTAFKVMQKHIKRKTMKMAESTTNLV